MIKIGDYNELTIRRMVDFGAYLSEPSDATDQSEVLLPRRYVGDDMNIGDTVRVFVYTDSEDRPVATTETPYARVGEFAFLQAVQINRVGAFMDWGLQKNLLVPFKEQKVKMFPGGIYLVYVYLDHNTQRVVASAKIEKFLGNVIPQYRRGERVDTLVIGRNEAGYQCIVDNLHRGIIYHNEVYRPLEIEEHLSAYIKKVRSEDNKIDLTLTAPDTLSRIELIAANILKYLKENQNEISENLSPEEIKDLFQCSKKDFKRSVGYLYKQHKIEIEDSSVIVLK